MRELLRPAASKGRMNTFRSLLAGLLLTASLSFAVARASAAAPAKDAYSLAVASYVEAATKELGAIRASGEASKQALPEELRSRYRDFEAKVKACEQLLAELQSATPGAFDPTKAKYERTRAEAVAALTKAQNP